MAYDMYEEPVSSKRSKMPRSTVTVLALGSVALLLCSASALVGGLLLGAVLFQSGGTFNSGPVIEIAPDAPRAPTMVPPESHMEPTVPPPDGGGATATPFPMNPTGGEGGGATATPLPFEGQPTAIP
jgi:hypothetical protein